MKVEVLHSFYDPEAEIRGSVGEEMEIPERVYRVSPNMFRVLKQKASVAEKAEKAEKPKATVAKKRPVVKRKKK